ncbi:hypothetical protein [Shewanella frigidimarina]|uniref:hypothetical protein n=1 Tax=Shewanella frigidimarina TaxID=56812 RepID=UPI003D7BC5A0
MPKDTIEDGHTIITVDNLFENVKENLVLSSFVTKLDNDCSKAYFTSLKKGLDIKINNIEVNSHELEVLTAELIKPVVIKISSGEVNIKITVGIGKRSLKEGGWYIICNGRLVMAAEQTEITGWRQGPIPQYHPDYAYFRGVVEFNSENSSFLPWTTTKTGVDRNNQAYRKALFEMKQHMLIVINFLKEKVKEEKQIKLYEIEDTVIADAIQSSVYTAFNELEMNDKFEAPTRVHYQPINKLTKVQYTVETSKLDSVKKSLQVDTATAAGTKTFEYYMKYEVQVE